MNHFNLSVRLSVRVRILVLLTLFFMPLFVFADEIISSNAGETVLPVGAMMERQVLESGEIAYFADQVDLAPNVRMVVPENSTLYFKELHLNPGSSIDGQSSTVQILVSEGLSSDGGALNLSGTKVHDTHGVDGVDGQAGTKASNALKGGSGANGGEAVSATDGGRGGDVTLMTPYLTGNLVVITRGGKGGQGGLGGQGGNGGVGFSGRDARTLYRFRGIENLPLQTLISIGAEIGVPVIGEVLAILQIFNGLRIGDGFDGYDGGQGGNGGRGGNGGNGGDAGNVDIVYGKQIEGDSVLVFTEGGAAGSAGLGGQAGIGGQGGDGGQRGDLWSTEGKPGKSGPVGVTGAAGISGRPGRSGISQVIESGDPLWLQCYIRYRILRDRHDPMAELMLRACSSLPL